VPAGPPEDVALADLVGFFKDPVKGFFRALDYTLPWDVDGVSDEISVDVDALEQWAVGDRMLNDMLRGLTPEEARQAEWRRGTLPPGQLGWRKAGELREQSALLAATALGYRHPDADAYDVDVDLGSGRRLTGTVSPVFGDRLVSVTYSKLGGKHLLAAWIPLLALFAHHPGRDWSAVCIGRPKRGSTPLEQGLGRPLEPAVDLLRDLVAIYDTGRREPLPLPVKTSYAWACARLQGDDPEREATFRWKSGNYPGEDQDPAQVRAWGRDAWLRDLMQPLRPGEEVDGETHRLGAYAARLWLPMLRAEVAT
jgi:exodeoxyribonuclease V gamma subunit